MDYVEFELVPYLYQVVHAIRVLALTVRLELLQHVREFVENLAFDLALEGEWESFIIVDRVGSREGRGVGSLTKSSI